MQPMAPLPSLASPWYEEMRNAHMAPLKPKAVARLVDFVREVTRTRLDELIAAGGEFDMVMDFGGFVVANSICRLFGLPATSALDLCRQINAITRPREDATVDFAEFFRQVKGFIVPSIVERRAAGG